MYLPPFRVPVSESALLSLDPMDVIDSHSSTVRRLIGDHFYTIDEIPRASAMAYLVETIAKKVNSACMRYRLSDKCPSRTDRMALRRGGFSV